jgi:hypothetical protein
VRLRKNPLIQKKKTCGKKYQSSDKAKEGRKRYLEKRKARLVELKQKPVEEVKPVENEPKAVK